MDDPVTDIDSGLGCLGHPLARQGRDGEVTLTWGDIEEKRFGNYRYLPVEADGSFIMGGWVQRPTALQKAKLMGFGIVDTREQKVIVQPDIDRRLEEMQRRIDQHRKGMEEAQATAQAIRKAVA